MIAPEFADDPKFIRRFEAEAQIVAGLEHPHIVPLYDYWREPSAAYLVMRLIGNNSLADTLANGALPPARAASVFAQLARRVAVCAPQRRRPPRRETGEHPDRPRRQRLPHRLRHGTRARCWRRRSRGQLGDRRFAQRAVRVARAAWWSSDVACLRCVQLGGRCREGAHRADRRLRGGPRRSPRHRPHRARPRHRPRPTPPLLERSGLRPDLDRSARRCAHGAARRRCDREPLQGVAGVRRG